MLISCIVMKEKREVRHWHTNIPGSNSKLMLETFGERQGCYWPVSSIKFGIESLESEKTALKIT